MKFIIAFALMVVAVSADRCMFPCIYLLKPVCGNDGKTYPNECAMRGAACRQGEAIVAVRAGNCPEDDSMRCNFPCAAIYGPVCGSDRKQYSNECMMRGASCRSGQAISVIRHVTIDGKTDCNSCNFACTQELRPVCGSDGNTHPTECVMNSKACAQKKAIVKIYDGLFPFIKSECSLDKKASQ